MEIQVGEYMRSDSGIILKYEYLKKYEDEVCLGQKGKCWSFEDEEEFEDFIEQRIIKHSPNIIDLIEEGDYVNGYKVSFIAQDCAKFVQCDYPVEAGTTNHYKFYKESIIDVVTKEQFNQRKYIVGGD